MSTTPTDHVTLLARRMRVDIDIATYPSVNYQQLLGIEELKPVRDLRTDSDESYDDEGAMREAVTGSNGRLELKVLHRTASDGVTVNPVHAFLKSKFDTAADVSTLAGEFGVMYYDRAGLEPAREGRAYVKAWSPDGGGPGARDTITLTIQFQGPTTEVANPNADLTPVVLSLAPATGAAAGGNLVTIHGTHLLGATGVKWGATNATNFVIVDDTTIVATAPAGSAGTSQVTVITPAGTSATTGTGNDYVYV